MNYKFYNYNHFSNTSVHYYLKIIWNFLGIIFIQTRYIFLSLYLYLTTLQ